MTQRRSILDLKHKIPPRPLRVHMRRLEAGTGGLEAVTAEQDGWWEGNIYGFPNAMEPLTLRTPTESGCENRVREEVRKRGYSPHHDIEWHWPTMVTYGYQDKTPFTGVCCVCGQHIGMGVTVQWNRVRQGNRWATKSVQCLKHRKEKA